LSKVQVDTIDTRSGTSTMQIGSTNTSTINIGVSGDTVNIPSGVTIANAGTATGFGGANTPAFEAFSTSDQAVNDNTTTKVQCASEVYDTASAYDNSSNYRFTPQTAGKFFCYGQVFIETPAQGGGTGATLLRQPTAYIYKNGAIVGACQNNFIDSQIKQFTATVSTVIDMNGSSDYIELYCYFDSDGGATGSIEGHASQRRTMFGAYKIII